MQDCSLVLGWIKGSGTHYSIHVHITCTLSALARVPSDYIWHSASIIWHLATTWHLVI